MNNFKQKTNSILSISTLLLTALSTTSCGYSEQDYQNNVDSTQIQNVSLMTSSEWESRGGSTVFCEEVEGEEGIEALEFFENFRTEKHRVWQNLESLESSEQILDLVLQRIRTHSPVFAQKLDWGLSKVSMNEWVDHDYTFPVNLVGGPQVDLPEDCSLNQISFRKSRTDYGDWPDVIVYFNEDLFKSLNPLNQAMLILHESIYLLGREIGHVDSEEVRALNSLLFSQNLQSDILNQRYFSQNAKAFQVLLSQTFGDYAQFFIEEEPLSGFYQSEHILHISNLTRSVSMHELNTELNMAVNLCLQEGFSLRHCQDRVMLSENLSEIVNTDEKAFLFLHNYFFDRYGMSSASTENFYWINPQDPVPQDGERTVLLNETCGGIEAFVARNLGQTDLLRFDNGLVVLSSRDQSLILDKFKDHVWHKHFIVPTLKYCKSIRSRTIQGNS